MQSQIKCGEPDLFKARTSVSNFSCIGREWNLFTYIYMGMNLWMLTTLPLEPLFRRDLWMQYKRRGGWNKLPAAGLTNHTGLVLDWGTGLIHWLASLTDLSEWLTLKIIGSAEDSSQVRMRKCEGEFWALRWKQKLFSMSRVIQWEIERVWEWERVR